ncbi:MAG: M15 family metallopeptidase [Synergistaceae bacterium]|nr:M15 family metallopeptidase [Synergistaceae bacterium]
MAAFAATAALSTLFLISVTFQHSAAAGQGGGVSDSARDFARAYPDAGIAVDSDDAGVYISIGKSRMIFSPAPYDVTPDPNSQVDQPICASLFWEYPVGAGGRNPAPGFDPGRVRHEGLMKLLYGADAESVRKNCVTVKFMGENVLFNARHGAADALARVAGRLEKLASAASPLRGYLLPTSGTFNWRTVKGSKRLSSHSFAIAIDLNVEKAPYWQWSSRNSAEVKRARENYPQAIVDAFEAEGFIWGGKWHSFDYMHFEYRPELLNGN